MRGLVLGVVLAVLAPLALVTATPTPVAAARCTHHYSTDYTTIYRTPFVRFRVGTEIRFRSCVSAGRVWVDPLSDTHYFKQTAGLNRCGFGSAIRDIDFDVYIWDRAGHSLHFKRSLPCKSGVERTYTIAGEHRLYRTRNAVPRFRVDGRLDLRVAVDSHFTLSSTLWAFIGPSARVAAK